MKNDTVVLLDGACGQVVEIITTDLAKVYKIKKLHDNEISYFDEHKVQLQRRSPRNFLVTFIMAMFRLAIGQ